MRKPYFFIGTFVYIKKLPGKAINALFPDSLFEIKIKITGLYIRFSIACAGCNIRKLL